MLVDTNKAVKQDLQFLADFIQGADQRRKELIKHPAMAELVSLYKQLKCDKVGGWWIDVMNKKVFVQTLCEKLGCQFNSLDIAVNLLIQYKAPANPNLLKAMLLVKWLAENNITTTQDLLNSFKHNKKQYHAK